MCGICAEKRAQEWSVKMELKLVMNTARSAVVEICDGGRYYTKKSYSVRVNGEEWKKAEKTILSLNGLVPGANQLVEVYDGEKKEGELSFTTDTEFVTLNVKQFGAKGDGEQDDTSFILPGKQQSADSEGSIPDYLSFLKEPSAAGAGKGCGAESIY